MRDGSIFLGEQMIMQEDGNAHTCSSIAGASDRLNFVLIVLAGQQIAETFVSVLAEHVLHIQTVLFLVVQVVFCRAFRTDIWDLFCCAVLSRCFQ